MFGTSTTDKLQQATQAQIELKVAFEAIGVDFTELNPIVHNALLKEALATSTDIAMANFSEALSALAESTASDEAKTRVLREFYADRARQFSD
jgi:ABC-type transporter Mla subunit MlaD